MLRIIANYISLTLLLLAFVIHIFKLVYLFYKPILLKKIKILSNDVPSKTDLALYYVLTIGSCYYAIIHILK
jgi:hypothetical protein